MHDVEPVRHVTRGERRADAGSGHRERARGHRVAGAVRAHVVQRDPVGHDVAEALGDMAVGENGDAFGPGSGRERFQKTPRIRLRAADPPREEGEEAEAKVQAANTSVGPPVADLPSITVVTPTLNGARHLPRALASVREQAYPNLEHIVVDGGSTDGTVDLLERASDVRWISEPDEGLADAVNKGIAMAGGDLVGWLNADDFYLPGALRAVADAAATHPEAAWITGRCRIVDGHDREIRRPVTVYKNLFLRHYSFPLYLTQNFLSCPSTFVRREAYDEAGPLETTYRYSMDYDVFLRIARRHDPLILNRELAAFRMDEGSLSMSGFERQFEEHAEQARRHGSGHPTAVAVNAAVSRTIVVIYRAMRAWRSGLARIRA
jgi:glycosyltransferase involved in cell wall biosynthesis